MSEKVKPFFLFYGESGSSESKKEYDELFNQYSYQDYQYYETKKELCDFVHKHRKEPYLLHGVPYKCMFLLICFRVRNLNWICWGQGSRINYYNWKSIIFTPIKKWMYHHFNSTIVLLEGDQKTLEHDFSLKNITLLPYYSGEELQLRAMFDRVKESKQDNHKPVVYIGNSGHCIGSYFELLDKLSEFAGKIELHCMLQYGPAGKEKLQQDLVALGYRLYGDNFYPDTNYMDWEAYLQYMNKCDVYICGAKSQSGLGAIYSSLALGKKVYVTGKNYEHIAALRYKIFELSSLDGSFIQPLSVEECLQNYNLFLLRQEPIRKGWVDYLEAL